MTELLCKVRCVSRHFWIVSRSNTAWPPDVNLTEQKLYVDDDVVNQFAGSKVCVCHSPWPTSSRGSFLFPAQLIQRLIIPGSLISSSGLQSVLACGGLRSLNIADCSHLADRDLQMLMALPNLCTLDLSRNRWLTDDGIANLKGLRLKKLKVVKCPGLTNKAIQMLADFNMPLGALDISHCAKLTSAALRFVAQMSLLRELAASHADHKEDIVELAKLNLFTLRFYKSELPPGTLRHFAHTRLLNFELYNCPNVTDADIEAVLSSLEDHPARRVVLSHCHSLAGAGMPTLGQLRHLEVLSLHHCVNLTELQFLQHLRAPLKVLDLTNCERIRASDLEYLAQLPDDARVVVANVPWSTTPKYVALRARVRWTTTTAPVR